MSKNQHICRLGLDEVKSCFAPLHPKRTFLDLFLRRLRQYIILDLNDKKCKSFFSNSKAARLEMKRHLNSPYRFIIHPFSKANAFMEAVFLLLMICRYTSLGFVFGEVIIRVQITADVLWFFLMLSIFFTGYVKPNTKEICIDPKAIALQYIRTYFIFDLAIMLETPLRLSTDNWTFHTALILLAIISYFVRFNTMLRSLNNILLYFGTNKLYSFFIYEILKLSFFLNLVTCVFIVIPEQVDPEFSKSWLYAEKKSSSDFEIYWHSFLIVVCYFFGADYGIDMSDPVENLVLFLLSFLGRLYTLTLIARVLAVFGITNIADSKYEQQLMVLMNYVNSLRIPEDLRHRIVTNYQKQSNKQHFDEVELNSNLTDTLKTELFLFGARTLITKHSVLSKIPRYDLLKFLSIMESKLYLSRDVIMSAGDEIKHVFFISSGTVAGYDVEGQEFMHLIEGDLFGISWMASRELKTSMLTWVALETTEVYAVSRKDLTKFFNYQKDVAKYFEVKGKEIFRKYEYYGTVTKWKQSRGSIATSLRKGEILERQRLRLVHVD